MRAQLITYAILVGSTLSVYSPKLLAQTSPQPVPSEAALRPDRPFAEYQATPTIGTGLDRVLGRSSYYLGGGGSERGGAFRMDVSRTTRPASFQLVLLTGGQLALRLEGQASVAPVQLHLTSIGRTRNGANFLGIQITPTARGRLTLQNWGIPLGSSYIFASADLIAHLLHLDRFSMTDLPPGSISLASLRVAISPGAGVMGSATSPPTSLAGAALRIDGRIVFSLAYGLQLDASGYFTQIYNLLRPDTLGTTLFGAGGSFGLLFGPPTGPNLRLLFTGSFDSIPEPTHFIGGVVGGTF